MPSLTVGDINDSPTSTYELPGGGTLTLRIGHLNGDTGGLASSDSALKDLPLTSFDAATLSSGENITNAAVATTGGTPHLYSVVATCTGPGNAQQEMQMIFKYTSATAAP